MSPGLQRRLPLLSTGAVFLALFALASMLYPGFFGGRVLVNLFTDNAALGIAAVGMTLVIFSGGIDLSVGAVIGFTSIFTATLIEQHGVHPALAAVAAIGLAAALGAGMGALIHWFKQPAFLVTLAGMFLMRGCAYWITTESIPLTNPLCTTLAGYELTLSSALVLPSTALALIAGLAIGGVVAHYTQFGRNLLAIGGSEQSALLMGLPLGGTRIGVYACNSMAAAVAGLVATLNSSGSAQLGLGQELDAIAVVVIGGTLLTGGRGHMLGTLLGLLIYGTIQQSLLFDGRLSSAWIRVVVGLLLLGFILLQRLLLRQLERR
jgi:ribose/xylose/arabinose/galactoside ABC-type transport system permease subunit